MYYIEKTIEISASHQLRLDYESKCCKLHGHNWLITFYCKSRTLDANGMVADFTHIRRRVEDLLDHQNLNEVLKFNPTAENIACWCSQQVPHCYKVRVQESQGNVAIYERDEDND